MNALKFITDKAKCINFILFFCSFNLLAAAHLEETLSVSAEEAAEKEGLFLDKKHGGFATKYKRKSKDILFPREDFSWSRGEQSQEVSWEAFKTLADAKAERVTFNVAKLYPFDQAGTCSAMALDFLARYMMAEKNAKNSNELKKSVKSFKPYYRANTTSFSSRQAAYNTIEVLPSFRLMQIDEQEKNKEDKMKSLALYHNIELKPVTKSMPLNYLESKLLRIINNLPNGHYVIRLLSPNSYNEKMENYGHTIIFIKANAYNILFDNSYGALELSGNVAEELSDHIIRWGLPECRFYQADLVQKALKNISKEKTFY